MNEKINVTQSYLPSIEKYFEYIQQIWESKHLTNNGPFVQKLEADIKQFLNLDNFLYCNNGTTVLQMALKSLNITKEVITTPFSYVATTNTILWEGAIPIFVDINENDFNIDITKIEEKITPNTQAILATHVFGNPCDVEKIEEIAQKHNLKVIYDAAHAFGTKYKNKSIFQFGDISTCSFHATKIFHTGEGGGLFCNNDQLYHQLKLIRQFGHVNDDYFTVGINGKSSEFHAALGLCVLNDFAIISENRKKYSNAYNELLKFNKLTKPKSIENTEYNYAYYPVVFESEEILLRVISALNKENIFPRRYFYPSLNKLPFLTDDQKCEISERISNRILCLPLSADFNIDNIKAISDIVNNNI
jgi:dTDP-4-amino-4,6-dideoxygalactose transaminase